MWAACIGQEMQYVRVPYFKDRFSLVCLFSAILGVKPITRSFSLSKSQGKSGERCDFNFLLPSIQFFTYLIFFCSSSSLFSCSSLRLSPYLPTICFIQLFEMLLTNSPSFKMTLFCREMVWKGYNSSCF